MVTTARTAPPRDDVRPSVLDRTGVVVAAALALAIAGIHVMDQGGLLGLKDPAYLGWGYRSLEVAAVVCAVLLLSGRRRLGWLLALAVAAGPLAMITISRSVGLPNATDDIGNWFETLGVAAMVVEASLIVIALTALATSSRALAARSAPVVGDRSSAAPASASRQMSV